MLHRTIGAVLTGSLILTLAACGGRLYKVAPLPAGAPPEISTSNVGGLNIGAVALDGQQSYERFEANLPLAGVIAVDVKMIKKWGEMIIARALRFDIGECL